MKTYKASKPPRLRPIYPNTGGGLRLMRELFHHEDGQGRTGRYLAELWSPAGATTINRIIRGPQAVEGLDELSKPSQIEGAV